MASGPARTCCAYCGVRFTASVMTLDHVAPRKGQTAFDRRDNLVLACPGCNTAKRDQAPMAFLLGIAGACAQPAALRLASQPDVGRSGQVARVANRQLQRPLRRSPICDSRSGLTSSIPTKSRRTWTRRGAGRGKRVTAW